MNDPATVERIRSIFLHKTPDVSILAASELLGLSQPEIEKAIEEGEIEIIATEIGARIARQELIAVALQTWPAELIEQALAGEAATVLPEALRLTNLRARIPRYQLAMLKYFAARERTTIGTILRRELDETAGAASKELAANIPGFAAALAWPDSPVPWLA